MVSARSAFNLILIGSADMWIKVILLTGNYGRKLPLVLSGKMRFLLTGIWHALGPMEILLIYQRGYCKIYGSMRIIGWEKAPEPGPVKKDLGSS